MADRLYIIAKAPRVGLAKTRLGHAIGHEAAVALYRAFLRDLAARFADAPFECGWYLTPSDAWDDISPLVDWGEREVRVLFQREGDLTERQREFFRGASERGEERVVLIASDSPHVTVEVVEQAFRELDRHDLVFGPTYDGGYYLIGMCGQGTYDVLHDVPMSTNTVLEGVIARARDAGLSVGWVETTFDVDEIEDLDHLRELVDLRPDLAAVRAALEGAGLHGDGGIEPDEPRSIAADPVGETSSPARDADPSNAAPILAQKNYAEPSVFTPDNLLREARRQKALVCGQVPPICVLDPDGDIVEHLRETERARLDPHWACYHTRLYSYEEGGVTYGIVGRAVGAPFAVLVAEELFASGCRLLISVTSAGQIKAIGLPPYFVLIERALRDEGTSYHYAPPSPYSELHPGLLEMLRGAFEEQAVPVTHGTAWTTDAPFRETAAQIEHHRSAGVLAVEMEAAALYAFGRATENPVVCFAHVTNQMASIEGDFEKGTAWGSADALRVIGATAERWLARNEHEVPVGSPRARTKRDHGFRDQSRGGRDL